MAEINTVIAEASQDLQTIEDFVNLPAGSDVRPRLLPSVNVGTLADARQAIFENGGLPATPFATSALMTASSLVDGNYAIVTNDNANNGLYVKAAGVWQRSGYDISNAAADSYSKLSGSKNLFNGFYAKMYLTGETPETMQLEAVNDNARSAIVAVKPNTKYRILKSDETGNYRIGLFKGKMATRAVASRLISRDNPLNGEIIITTQADETALVVTVAINRPTEKPVFIEEIGGEDAHVKLGKNLFYPNYERGFGIVVNPDADLGILRYDLADTGIIARSNIKPSTTYTLSKGVSNRFKVFELIARPFGGGYLMSSRTLFNDDSASVATFTTSSDALMLIIYLSNGGEKPFVQLEVGGVKTTWENYGYKLKDGVSLFKDSRFPKLDTSSPTITADLIAAVNSAKDGVVYIPSGTYVIDHTITLPSNSRIIGLGEVVFKLADDFTQLSAVDWRHLRIRNLVMSAPDSTNIYMENIKIVGSDVADFDFMHWGLGMQGTGHTLNRVSVEAVNYIVEEVSDRRIGGNGWGLVFFNAKDCKVFGGSFTKGGYENIGTEDSENILFDGVHIGEGWRTAIQFHKGSKNISLINSTIRQLKVTTGYTHATITIHGIEANPVDGILIDNCDIDGQVSDDITWEKGRGGIQTVEGNEHNVTIVNNFIRSNKDGITGNSEGAGEIKGWIISNNRVETERESIQVRGGSYGIITGNIVKAPNDIKQSTRGSQYSNIGNFVISSNLFIDTSS